MLDKHNWTIWWWIFFVAIAVAIISKTVRF